MKIANPIYDVVFKYMMEDPRAAKIFLSEVTGLDIVSLEYLPQEQLAENQSPESKSVHGIFNLSVFRLDFSAIIREADGSEQVILIELQKSNVNPQIMRFRKYLGKQYMNELLFRWVEPRVGRKYKRGLPILPIYILGGAMAEFSDVPVLDIDYQIRDRYAGKVLESSNHFIESLFHRGIIINLPALNDKRRDDLEKLLSIFDYQNTRKNKHVMHVKETDFPDRFHVIMRRLNAAIKEAELQSEINQEDEVLAELHEQRRYMEKARLIAEEGMRAKEEGKRMEKEGKRMEKEGKRMEEEGKRMKENALRVEENALRVEEQAVRKQEQAIKLLLEAGISAEEISTKLELPLEKVIDIGKS